MCDQQSITCRDCMYVEACFSLNSEMQKHHKDFLESDLCAKQCKTFKAREDYASIQDISNLLRNLKSTRFADLVNLNASQLSLLSMLVPMLSSCRIRPCTDDNLYGANL